MKRASRILMGFVAFGSLNVFADPIYLDDSDNSDVPSGSTFLMSCDNANNTGKADSSDLTGSNDLTVEPSNSTGCWGETNGNDKKGPIVLEGITYDFISKNETSASGTSTIEGMDIGLKLYNDASGTNGITCSVEGSASTDGDTSGCWSYDPTKFIADAFLVVIKAANSPGYAVYLFEDGSFFGSWLVAWANTGPGISHMSIYAADFRVPEPGTLALLGLGLAAFGVARRRGT